MNKVFPGNHCNYSQLYFLKYRPQFAINYSGQLENNTKTKRRQLENSFVTDVVSTNQTRFYKINVVRNIKL